MYICNDCPRNCSIDRDIKFGFCACGRMPYVTRAAPHFGEEPCISGTNGSGTVFFSGCNLKCSFCQNHEISRKQTGKQVDEFELSDIMIRLQEKGVHNINLVTPTHFSEIIAKSLILANLKIPVVWNSSGYEKAETLKKLEGLVDIYMPDYKYADHQLAKKYSYAEDYPEVAGNALKEMYRQTGKYIFDNGLLKSGLLVRHLILPGYTENSMDVIDFISDNFPQDSVLFSLMSQFTPMKACDINNRVTEDENEMLIHYMKLRGLSGFSQDNSSSTDELIPNFDLTGVK